MTPNGGFAIAQFYSLRLDRVAFAFEVQIIPCRKAEKAAFSISSSIVTAIDQRKKTSPQESTEDL
jgi:hypothetical protein